jgi:hypothetical protein
VEDGRADARLGRRAFGLGRRRAYIENVITFDLVRVVDVRPVRDHVLWLRFSDGAEGEVDVEPLLDRGLLAELRNPELFAQVRLEGITVAWPNGVDLHPGSLHDRLVASKSRGAQPNDDEFQATSANLAGMPELSRFFGIVIKMFFIDHARPHFHAELGEYAIAVEIEGDGVHGRFPPHRLPLVFEWRDRHRDELLANWQRLRRGEQPTRIAPLD